MKRMMSLVLVLAVLIIPCGLFAQQEKTTITTTETSGTVSSFSPNTIVVRPETSSSPMTYSYTKGTAYIDENGAPVSIKTVTSGVPVKVYYTQEGDRLIANKVVVRTTTTTTKKPGSEEKQTTTTTTTEKQ